MSSQAERIVNDFCAAFARRNIDELMTYFAVDAVYHNVPATAATGKDAIRKALESYVPLSRSIEFRVLRSAVAGDVVFNERLDIFDMNGKRVELPVAGIFELAGGKITLWRDYFDMGTWTRQMQ